MPARVAAQPIKWQQQTCAGTDGLLLCGLFWPRQAAARRWRAPPSTPARAASSGAAVLRAQRRQKQQPSRTCLARGVETRAGSRALLTKLRTRTLCAPALRASAEAARACVVECSRGKRNNLRRDYTTVAAPRGQHGATDGLLSCVQLRLSRVGGMCGGQAREQARERRVRPSGQEHGRMPRRRGRGACGCDACGRRICSEREMRGGACACAWRWASWVQTSSDENN
jgi:hypothetical protein